MINSVETMKILKKSIWDYRKKLNKFLSGQVKVTTWEILWKNFVY